MTSSPTVYVVDDDESVRKALARLFRSSDLAVETFEAAGAFLEHELADGPACLVLDVQMPGRSGIELQKELVEHRIDLPIVFMTAHGDISMAVEAMKWGAVDFLPKPVANVKLLETVKRAIERNSRQRREATDVRVFQRRVESLTKREHEVMALVVTGLLNKQIASELGISLDTVKVHRGRVMAKTGVDSLAELVSLWLRAQRRPE
jgi:FixJ family two-component response regulator